MRAITKKNLTLLALALAEGKPLSPVQLQKAVFLLQEKLPDGAVSKVDRYEFAPYNYGPFASAVYKDAQMLSEEGLAVIEQSGAQYSNYAANEHGVKRGQEIAKHLSAEANAHAKEIMDWVRAQSFRSLVSAIYEEYPQYRVNSVFKG